MSIKHNAKHQAAFRARKSYLGLKEVRGAWAHKDDAEAVRRYADKRTKLRAKKVPA